MTRDGNQSATNSQMMMLRGSITGSMQTNAQTLQNPTSNRG